MNADDQLASLVEVLDAELELLGALSYRFVVLASLIAADQGAWIPRSVRELEQASEQLRLMDLRRAAVTEGVTTFCHLGPEARLGEIAGEVAAGWGGVLGERRRVLLEQMANLQSLAELTRSAMSRRSALAEEALAFLRDDGGATYGPRPARGAQIVKGAM